MRSRIVVPVMAIVVVAAAVGIVLVQRASEGNGAFTLSGTIEATEIHLGSQNGGRVKKLYVNEGDFVQTGQNLVDIYKASGGVNESVTSPIDGVVLTRLIETGEIAAPGSTLIVVADLDALTLKVYVPEDRYGQIGLGQSYPVTVDSFPGQVFNARVRNIANKAEFTPRNVQTIDSRKSTVFAVTLDLVPTGGKLKPGMPADVHFQMKR